MSRLTTIALVVWTMGCNGSFASQSPQAGQRYVRDIEFQGAARQYILYVPGLPKDELAPLLVVLHGGMGNAESIERSTGMDALADSGGFLVAYPQGTGMPLRGMPDRRTWNAGTCCGAAMKRNIDDVTFLSEVIDAIVTSYPVDRRRVYVTGISNGGMMAYRLAEERPAKVAAIAVVAGSLGIDDFSAAKDVPVLHIHGDRDRNIPFAGGKGEQSLSGVEFRSVADTIELVLAPRGETTRDEQRPGERILRTSYRCSAGAPVTLVVLEGTAHGWPGGERDTGPDRAPDGFSASEAVWSFVRAFSKEK